MKFTEIYEALANAINNYPDLPAGSYDDLSHALDLLDTWAESLDDRIDEAYERRCIARYESDLIRSHEG